MEIFGFIATVILITASGALAPGPLFFATVSNGAKSGARSGLMFSVAHTVVEFSLIMLLAVGLLTVANETIVKLVIGIAGGIALIAFGLLYGFGFTGVVIRSINNYYIENLTIHNFLNDISHIIIAIAVFSFLIIVAQKEFNKLINIKIAKIVALIALIFSIIILFIEEVIIILILIFF